MFTDPETTKAVLKLLVPVEFICLEYQDLMADVAEGTANPSAVVMAKKGGLTLVDGKGQSRQQAELVGMKVGLKPLSDLHALYAQIAGDPEVEALLQDHGIIAKPRQEDLTDG